MSSPKTRSRLPIEAREFVPEPRIVLFGCRPLVPYHGYRPDPGDDGPPFHAPFDPVAIGDRNWPRDRCPTCKGQIGLDPRRITDRVTACGWCSAVSPANEDRARAQRVGAKSREADARTRAQCQAEIDAAGGGTLGSDKTAPKTPILSEKARRHFAERHGAIGRAWLRAIGQLPDYSLALDHRGRVVPADAEPAIAPGTEPAAATS